MWNGSGGSGFRFGRSLWGKGALCIFSTLREKGAVTVPVSVLAKKNSKRFRFQFLEQSEKTKGQQLEGKIVSDIFHTFQNFFLNCGLLFFFSNLGACEKTTESLTIKSENC